MITISSKEVKSLRSRAKQVFELVTADLPDPVEVDPNLVVTSKVLAGLARSWPEPLSDDQRRDLEALCRKVHVAKKLMSVYAPGWKRVSEPVPLSLPYWSLAVAVLLGYSHLEEAENEEARGLGFKFLNAALMALDLARTRGIIPHLSELRTWAEEVLENLSFAGET
jgi:hypothetical protein